MLFGKKGRRHRMPIKEERRKKKKEPLVWGENKKAEMDARRTVTGRPISATKKKEKERDGGEEKVVKKKGGGGGGGGGGIEHHPGRKNKIDLHKGQREKGEKILIGKDKG